MPTIMIVDGQRSSRQYLAELLGPCSRRIIEAEDGPEALEMLATIDPDLVITDVLLRMMDGYEFVEELRARPVAAPPVVFCVGASYEEEAKKEAPACGVEHVINRAADPESILGIISKVVSNKNARITPFPKVNLGRLNLIPPADPIDPKATVFVVDDDPAMCRLIASVLHSSNLKLETYSSAEDFLDDYRDEPGCLLVDLDLPGMSGIAMLAALRARRMQIPTIIMTGAGELADAKLAMRFRVMDFLDKSVSRRTLLARVYSALQEDSHERHSRADVETNHQRLASLTARERDLVRLLVQGRASKEIAAALKISVKTVAIHRAHLMAKTGATNVADLVRMSIISGDA